MERRQASAPAAEGRRKPISPWRAPHPLVRTVSSASAGVPLPSFFLPFFRHCERSEAIQCSGAAVLGCFVAIAPRNDGESTLASSPVQTGEGDRALARWKGRLTRRSTVVARVSSSSTPPPPCFAWSPFPAIAGQEACVRRCLTTESETGALARQSSYACTHDIRSARQQSPLPLRARGERRHRLRQLPAWRRRDHDLAYRDAGGRARPGHRLESSSPARSTLHASAGSR